VSTPLTLHRHDAPGARDLFDEAVAVHQEIYREAPFTGVPYFSADRFRDRLAVALCQPGFELVAASDHGRITGYLYGWALPRWTRWWTPFAGVLPAELTRETGDRTVFIQEIMVRAPWRGRGIARRLHDEFLAARAERRGLICVQPDNEPARSAYLRWGWKFLSSTTFDESGPVFDCLVKTLTETLPGDEQGCP
jgi:GNAT superfamily N-acetyltransferase